MRKKLWKKTIAVCLSIAMCFGMITVPQAVYADELLDTDSLEENGGIWKFIATDTENVYYIQNVKEEKYLASSGNGIALTDDPYPILAEKTSSDGYKFNFSEGAETSVSKPFLAVGTDNKYSLGEKHLKDMFLFEKSIKDGNSVYTSTSEITNEHEYVLAMEHKSISGTKYALTSQITDSGTSARGVSEALNIKVVVVETWANLTEAGVLWNVKKNDDGTGWYLYNVKAGKYIKAEANGNIELSSDTPTKHTAELQADGTYLFSNGTSKGYFAVGTGNKISVGEHHDKNMALFEKVRIPNGLALRKTSELQEGRDYVLAMAHRDNSATTAEATVLYALTDQTEGSGSSSARILSHTLSIENDEISFITSESDAACFGRVTVEAVEPEANKTPEDVQVSVQYALDGEYTVITNWTPQDAAFGVGRQYTVQAVIAASGKHSFDENSLPTQISLGNGRTEALAEDSVSLSDDKKTITLSYAFAPIENALQTPEFDIPDLPAVGIGTKLGDISLPEGFTFDEDTDTVLDTKGTFTYHLTYTPEDTENYKIVTAIEVQLTVKEGIASFEEQGVLWKFEKATDENGWYLKNVAAGKYLSDDGTAYSSSNETPRIALNDSPIQYVATLNTDGTFRLHGGSDQKPYLAVGSGNRISIGEHEQKTVLFEKVRDGEGFGYRKVQQITDGHEYIVAMTHRDNDATAATALSLFAMTNQMHGNNRLESYAFSIVSDKIDVTSGLSDTVCLRTPVITLPEPKAGNAQEPASVEIQYALEDEYQTATVWSPTGDAFASGTAYGAVITITAQGTHYFDPDQLPESIILDNGSSVALSENNCSISDDNKVITMNVSFEALPKSSSLTVEGELENGTVTVNGANVTNTNINVNTEVTITAVPAEGCRLKEFKIMAGTEEVSCTEAENGIWKFIMPEEAVTVTVVFEKITYEIVTEGLENCTTEGLPKKASYGDEIAFGLVPQEGFSLKSLTVTEQESGKQIETAEEDGIYSFTMPETAVLIEAKFTRGEFTLDVEQSDLGEIEISQEKAKVGVNIFVTLEPKEGYKVEKVIVRKADGTEIAASRMDDTFYLFSMPGQNATVTAVFVDKKAVPPATEVQKLNAPALTSVTSTKTGVSVTWGSVSGAVSYDVYRTVSGKQIKVANTTVCSYLDMAAESGTENSYSVTAVAADQSKNSAQSAKRSVTLPANVKNLKVKVKKGSMTVSFKKVSGAKKYFVYRAESKNGAYKLVKTLGAKKTSYTDKKVKKGKSYYYKVVVMNGSAYSIPAKAVGKKAK